ncbi:mitochondrial fission process protein 1 [Hylaeus volcanicus]|uniref:mitochondrial fission process protein 1 n=1 Tax=Hylaeus volcanicus TaxID=313075 RepID=UPI0023B7972A|nr:mitochondrial fission process protein 1 [Hylaeus volcanicus]
MKNTKEEVDLYRDTYVRYLGYTNEVGEAFRPIIPRSVVWLSYLVASGYVVADTVHKGIKQYSSDTTSAATKNAFFSMSDTLLWQSFASVIIPGFTINRICATVQYVQRKSTNVALKNRWISTIVGLVSIPFIIHPIDHMVEDTMNLTYRKWIGYHPNSPPTENVDNSRQ